MLTLLQPLPGHNGNPLQFSPRASYLYIGIGVGEWSRLWQRVGGLQGTALAR